MKMVPRIKKWLEHPLTKGLDLDDPETTALRREIIQQKPFLRNIYREWFEWILSSLPDGKQPVLELGSGGGFFEQMLPGLITSEVFLCSNIRLVLDGHSLPFSKDSLRGIVMTDVLHHLSHSEDFFREAARCVKPGGVITLVEPWCTTWSRLVYTHLHHEPFAPEMPSWEFPTSGPLSGANGALPWILFERDRKLFNSRFPEWEITYLEPVMPFRYLLSGGVSMRTLSPEWSYPLWVGIEKILKPWSDRLGMFAKICLTRLG